MRRWSDEETVFSSFVGRDMQQDPFGYDALATNGVASSCIYPACIDVPETFDDVDD
jgi:hypothetical protein